MRACPFGVFVLVFRFAFVFSKHLLEFAANLVNFATDLAADGMFLLQFLENLTKLALRLGLRGVQLQAGAL